MASATTFFMTSPTNPGNRKYMNTSSDSSRTSSYTTSVREEAAVGSKGIAMDNVSETSSFTSMNKFMSTQVASQSSKRQAVAEKLREWRAESHATWKKVQPYYEDIKYWVLMGPH